jgi:ubiquinone/menaquinone biosynthesis C-methylase UbiE
LSENPIVATYSRLADAYASVENQGSCWGRVSRSVVGSLAIGDSDRTVVDVGCGTGIELARLASSTASRTQFIGVEPAAKMRELAAARTAEYDNVRILDGSFERIPLEERSVDYLYSILAFHWVTDLERSVSEIRRVLRSSGGIDLSFIGRENGREFIQKTTPVFFRYLSPAEMIRTVSLRKQLTVEQAAALFGRFFPRERLRVEESFTTYYDSLDGHWAWWVRIEGQFLEIPAERKAQCENDVRKALATLATTGGIPYTVHLIRVRVG